MSDHSESARTREDFEEAVSVAKENLADSELVMAGSLGPLFAAGIDTTGGYAFTVDFDVVPLTHHESHFDADESIGRESVFFGERDFYVDRLGDWVLMTAAQGWKDRLVKIDESVSALSIHDAVWVKLDAGREKDIAYVGELIGRGLVDADRFRSFCHEAQGGEIEGFESLRSKVLEKLEDAGRVADFVRAGLTDDANKQKELVASGAKGMLAGERARARGWIKQSDLKNPSAATREGLEKLSKLVARARAKSAERSTDEGR